VIPGRRKLYTLRHFRRGLRCGIVGCTRRARHQWAYPCAVRTMAADPRPPRWLAVCDECDLLLNRVLLAAMGVPPHVLDELIGAYRLIQADGAFDVDPDPEET